MNTDVLLEKLPLELRSPRKGEQPIVTNSKAQAYWVGHILGDGYISKSKGYMAIDQASENLSNWFHKILKALNILPKDSEVQKTLRLDKRSNQTTVSYRFTTRAYKVDRWVETFYKIGPNGKKQKTIPKNIGDLLIDPFSLAIWFLGDGWFDGDNVSFAAGTLTDAEYALLKTCLLNNFGLETSLVALDPSKNNGRTGHRITVAVSSYNNFYELVSPFLEQFCQDQNITLESDPFLKRKVLPKIKKA
jgi:hypothetical protein